MDAEDELKHDGMDDEPRDNEVEQQFTYDQISCSSEGTRRALTFLKTKTMLLGYV